MHLYQYFIPTFSLDRSRVWLVAAAFDAFCCPAINRRLNPPMLEGSTNHNHRYQVSHLKYVICAT